MATLAHLLASRPSMPKGLLPLVLRELLRGTPARRIPEPSPVMECPRRAVAYDESAAVSGMDAVYLFHASQASLQLEGAQTVLDIGCGSGLGLTLLARLHPDTAFIGVDLSETMLAQAEARAGEQGLTNIRWVRGDICTLDSFADGAVDAVVSSLCLHHLLDEERLAACFDAIGRVLRPHGATCILDFGRLGSHETIQRVVSWHQDLMPDLVRRDYEHSLLAAFTPRELAHAARRKLPGELRVSRMALLPMMVLMQSGTQRTVRHTPRRRALRAERQRLPPAVRTELDRLRLLFALGGVGSDPF